ncbi:DUF4856 domain-containing protein [Aquimarina agarilytica]|uniref:DUF4856 domain-containing protein n=1 Tax=Aquimarina agarilytica TaxID=1087449 RepID=UPI0002880161|nr:DUF4856 domain-containing protein [Aquimarina agarilytica]
MKLGNILKFGVLTTAIVACNSDDSSMAPSDQLDVPAKYEFTRNGESTVSFSGQTTRLKQGAEILKDFTTFGTDEATIDRKFADGEGFADTALNDTKNIRTKVAESVDYFKTNSVEQAEIRGVFDGYIAEQVAILLSKYASADEVPVATRGTVGKLEGRFVNEKGLELNQAFNKGLIGALTLDQIINDYLSLTEGAAIREANDAGTLDEGNPYTEAEHFWDEAYGYLYGASDADVLSDPNSKHLETVVDNFLYKYVQRVEGDKDFEGIADRIFQAFKTGRAAITAGKYEESEKQADIIRLALSEVIGIRAVFYLKQGADKIRRSGFKAVTDGTAFHDWSEGYGFIYSLRFTQDPGGKPYFSKTEVDGFLATLNAGDGFWDLADKLETVDNMAEQIAEKFDFTVDQAKDTGAVNK